MKEKSPLENLLRGILKFVTDLQYIFHKDFIKENYYKHFGYSLPLTFVCICIGLWLFDLQDTGALPTILGGFGAFAFNGIRESILEEEYDAPFSWTDINIGGRGGTLGGFLASLFF